MPLRLVRMLLVTLGVGGVAGCAPVEPAAAPAAREGKSDHDIQREQQTLERRRLHLEKQLLAELRKLRDSRQASTGAAEPARDAEPSAAGADDLLLFGGANYEVFLGCLCDEQRPDSVFNMLGEHGSHLSATSIRNKFAPYGSNYDNTSACNAAATKPPRLVAANGKSLGLLTLNASLKKGINIPSVTDWLARMCGE
jgi:hypothetical protein